MTRTQRNVIIAAGALLLWLALGGCADDLPANTKNPTLPDWEEVGGGALSALYRLDDTTRGVTCYTKGSTSLYCIPMSQTRTR